MIFTDDPHIAYTHIIPLSTADTHTQCALQVSPRFSVRAMMLIEPPRTTLMYLFIP